jgi:hypothetical protein
MGADLYINPLHEKQRQKWAQKFEKAAADRLDFRAEVGCKMEKTTIEMAIIGLEEQKKKIEQALAELRTQLDGRDRQKLMSEGGEKPTPFVRRRRKMSAEAKRKISEAMKRRYAEMGKVGTKKAA